MSYFQSFFRGNVKYRKAKHLMLEVRGLNIFNNLGVQEPTIQRIYIAKYTICREKLHITITDYDKVPLNQDLNDIKTITKFIASTKL